MDESSALTPQTYVQQTALVIWENLPKIVIAGAGFSLTAVPAGTLMALGLLVPALLIAIFTIVPAWAALLAFENEIAEEKHPPLRLLIDAFVRHAGDSIRLGALLLPFALGLIWLLPGLSAVSVSPLQWAGIVVCIVGLAVLITLYLYAFPLLSQHEMTYGVALRNSALLASRHAANSVGLLSMVVISALTVVYFSIALLFFLPMLFGMFVVNNCKMVVALEKQINHSD